MVGQGKQRIRRSPKRLASSQLRMKLKEGLCFVRDSGNEIVILSADRPIGLLSLEKPGGPVPSMLIKIQQAKDHWSELLELAKVSNAKFYFSLRVKNAEQDGPVHVYLTRWRGYQNAFQQDWREHRAASIRNTNSGQLDERLHALKDELTEQLTEELTSAVARVIEDIHEKLDRRISVAFAAINREGDLLATPENGLVPFACQDNVRLDG